MSNQEGDAFAAIREFVERQTTGFRFREGALDHVLDMLVPTAAEQLASRPESPASILAGSPEIEDELTDILLQAASDATARGEDEIDVLAIDHVLDSIVGVWPWTRPKPRPKP